MPHRVKILFITVLYLLQLTGNAQNNTGIKTTVKTYAVVIGISKYQSKELKPLQFADKDAGLFAAWLQSDAGGKVPAEQIKLLQNEQATIAAVYDALDWLKENCSEKDIVYFYFSGHGDVETKNSFSKGYLLAYNTPSNNYRNNAIRIEDINSIANSLSLTNKANVILVTDACHSGKLAGDFYKGKQLVAAQLQIVLNNEVRLASCAVDEEAAEGIDWDGGRGVFSYYLLRGLQGMAESEKDGIIKLNELSKFLDSSVSTDKYLKLDKHKQHPVTDGNPYFALATIDTSTLIALTKGNTGKTTLPASFENFTTIGRTPLDYFISLVRSSELDTILNFESYTQMPTADVPVKMTDDCFAFMEVLKKLGDSLLKKGEMLYGYDFLVADTLALLKNQLIKNKALRKSFNERFVQAIHEKGQDMINAYLTGDIAELEKRQYYYAGNRQYHLYLSQLDLALYLVPKDNQLSNILHIHKSYITGLINRLEMATTKNTDSLLALAFTNQIQALQLEPYAAYIHNELGNLYLHRKKYDSAEHHFALAVELSPTWAVPWSNRIRMNLALKKKDKAIQAIYVADSLQPNLAYVMINAGLVMEQNNNLLAAESYYKKAIAQNHVHYLPYERLGYVYLKSGEYEKADKYFYDASLRKEAFSVNDKYFRYGVELGGLSVGDYITEWEACNNSTVKSILQEPYLKLATGLQQLKELVVAKKAEPTPFFKTQTADSISSLDAKQGIKLLKEAISLKADIPLAQHYIGKQLYKEGQWQLAEEAIVKALAAYQNDSLLRSNLYFQLYGNNFQTADTCLLHRLMYYQYDVSEDHYLLGQLYSKKGLYDKAAEEYLLISEAENKRQMEQAVFAGFDFKKSQHFFRLQQDDPGMIERLMAKYELPLNMYGYIKAARLYEQQGDYNKAEKILLHQLQQCRDAGNARQQTLNKGKKGPAQILTGIAFNYYWLQVNRNIEGELYNFYKKVTTLFPRDGEWKEKAGLFLYRRLAMTFEQMPAEEQQPYYESMSMYAYPFLGSEEPADWGDVRFTIPGTDDTIEIKMPVYDPVKESLENLEQSVKLSGDIQPGNEIKEALADLNSWIGNKEVAVKLYNELVNAETQNIHLRNKFINYLIAYNELPAAYKQLEILYKQQQIQPGQIQLLATCHILSGNHNAAQNILKVSPVKNADEKRKFLSLYVIMNMLTGKPDEAIIYLNKIPAKAIAPQKEDFKNDIDYYTELDNYEKQQRYYSDFVLYSKARALALLKRNDEAIRILRQALDSGFQYQYMLHNDPVWDKIRGTKKWDALTEKYQYRDYSQDYREEFRNPVGYRVPNVINDEVK